MVCKHSVKWFITIKQLKRLVCQYHIAFIKICCIGTIYDVIKGNFDLSKTQILLILIDLLCVFAVRD